MNATKFDSATSVTVTSLDHAVRLQRFFLLQKLILVE